MSANVVISTGTWRKSADLKQNGMKCAPNTGAAATACFPILNLSSSYPSTQIEMSIVRAYLQPITHQLDNRWYVNILVNDREPLWL